MPTNNDVATFVLAMHNKAVANLSDTEDITITTHEGNSRSRVVVRSGESQLICYYDGYSDSMPHRTMVKENNRIVFHHNCMAGIRKSTLSLAQKVAIQATLANPGNSHNVSQSLLCLS